MEAYNDKILVKVLEQGDDLSAELNGKVIKAEVLSVGVPIQDQHVEVLSKGMVVYLDAGAPAIKAYVDGEVHTLYRKNAILCYEK